MRYFLFRAVSALLLSATLAGCEMFSSDYWHTPSPLTAQPPPPEAPHEKRGGFSVLVGAPDQPGAARVFADVGTFAQERGFVRGSGNVSPPAGTAAMPSGPQRYFSEGITLDIAYQSASYQVVVTLHGFSSRLNAGYVRRFSQDFRQRYGEETAIVENSLTEDSGGNLPAGGGRGGRPAGGGGHGGGR